MRHLLIIVFLLVLLVGCGSKNPLGRLPITGRVTLDGAPLDRGSISFEPTEARGVASGTTVHDGQFSIPAEKGLPPGRYSVRINSAKSPALPKTNLPPGPHPQTSYGVERVAPVYNAASTVTVELVAGETTSFQFDTKSK